MPNPRDRSLLTEHKLKPARLEGEAMAVALEPPGPTLWRVRTTAPAILSLTQGNTPAQTMVFPAGADLYRYLVATNFLDQ